MTPTFFFIRVLMLSYIANGKLELYKHLLGKFIVVDMESPFLKETHGIVLDGFL